MGIVAQGRKDVNSGSLFDWRPIGRDFGELPRQRHSPTSRHAAERAARNAPTLRTRILAAFEAAGPRGLTDDEGISQTGIAGNSYRPRRIGLTTEGRLRDSGRTRPTATGAAATVWTAVR